MKRRMRYLLLCLLLGLPRIAAAQPNIFEATHESDLIVIVEVTKTGMNYEPPEVSIWDRITGEDEPLFDADALDMVERVEAKPIHVISGTAPKKIVVQSVLGVYAPGHKAVMFLQKAKLKRADYTELYMGHLALKIDDMHEIQALLARLPGLPKADRKAWLLDSTQFVSFRFESLQLLRQEELTEADRARIGANFVAHPSHFELSDVLDVVGEVSVPGLEETTVRLIDEWLATTPPAEEWDARGKAIEAYFRRRGLTPPTKKIEGATEKELRAIWAAVKPD